MKIEIRSCFHDHGRSHLHAFGKGALHHGDEIVDLDGEIIVMWAHRDREVIDGDRPFVVLEQGYVGNRKLWTSVGLNGLNGRAQFPQDMDDGKRWRKNFPHLLKSWRPKQDGYALLCGQVPGDAALEGADHTGWLARMSFALRAAKIPVRFRPHPEAIKAQTAVQSYGDIGLTASNRSLGDDLAGAAYVVTWNSNVATDAVLAGVPTIAFDEGSMAWPVTGHALDEIVCPLRERWAADLAWAQWQIDEIASGDAWEALKTCL